MTFMEIHNIKTEHLRAAIKRSGINGDTYQELKEKAFFPASILDTAYQNYSRTIAGAVNVDLLNDFEPKLVDGFLTSSKILNWVFCQQGYTKFGCVAYVDDFIEELLGTINSFDQAKNNLKIKDILDLVELNSTNLRRILLPVNQFFDHLATGMDVLGNSWSIQDLSPELKVGLLNFAGLSANQDPIVSNQGKTIQNTINILERTRTGLLNTDIQKQVTTAILTSFKDINYHSDLIQILQDMPNLNTLGTLNEKAHNVQT